MTQEELTERMRLFGSAFQINGNVGQINMGDGVYHASSEKKPSNAREEPPGADAPHMPESADKYWRLLRQHGFTDERRRLLPSTTRAEAMLIADCFSDAVGIKSRWKTFEAIWGINNLAQEKWKMQENGRRPSRADEIEAIFGV